jgi:hypothetical protein
MQSAVLDVMNSIYVKLSHFRPRWTILVTFGGNYPFSFPKKEESSTSDWRSGAHLKDLTLPRDLRLRGTLGGPQKKKKITCGSRAGTVAIGKSATFVDQLLAFRTYKKSDWKALRILSLNDVRGNHDMACIRARVTRWACEKIAQTVAQAVFVKINTQLYP